MYSLTNMTAQEFTDSMVESATEYLEAKGVLNTIRAQAIETAIYEVTKPLEGGMQINTAPYWTDPKVQKFIESLTDYLDTLK